MVVSSEGSLVFLALENVKLVKYEDTALAREDNSSTPSNCDCCLIRSFW